jgi:hypothetical protein
MCHLASVLLREYREKSDQVREGMKFHQVREEMKSIREEARILFHLIEGISNYARLNLGGTTWDQKQSKHPELIIHGNDLVGGCETVYGNLSKYMARAQLSRNAIST